MRFSCVSSQDDKLQDKASNCDKLFEPLSKERNPKP